MPVGRMDHVPAPSWVRGSFEDEWDNGLHGAPCGLTGIGRANAAIPIPERARGRCKVEIGRIVGPTDHLFRIVSRSAGAGQCCRWEMVQTVHRSTPLLRATPSSPLSGLGKLCAKEQDAVVRMHAEMVFMQMPSWIFRIFSSGDREPIIFVPLSMARGHPLDAGK